MKPFEVDKDISRLLILTPYRPSISEPTIVLLDSLTRCGATALKLPGCSDIALARNLLAQAACEFIGKSSQDIDVVMWLDADMFAEREVIFRQLNHLAELETDIRDGMSAISGMYCRRREANVITAARVNDEPCMLTKDGSVLVPAHTGLGCFMQSAVSFLDNCQTADQIVNERGQIFPFVCQSAPRVVFTKKSQSASDTPRLSQADLRSAMPDGLDMKTQPASGSQSSLQAWGQEDWWYCERLWTRDVAVYVDTSCPWGHLAESLSLPMGIPAGLLLETEAALLEPLADKESGMREP
jgi:hypothetical protein